MSTLDVTKQPTEALQHMIKSLSSLQFFNTEEENQRLAAARKELSNRRKQKRSN
jgi:hypothetical protein